MLVVRLFFLQVLWHDFFLDKATRQHRFSMTLQPKRGKILDRKGRDLATSIPVKSFYAVPGEIRDVPKTAKILAKVFDMKEKDILDRITRKKSFIWLKRRLNESEAEKIISLKVKGVYFLEESKRVYPGHQLLSHVLGFTDLDEKGLEGLELRFDKYLRGKPGWRLAEHDAKGKEILTPLKYEVDPRDGMNLVLTIDAAIQTMAEEELDEIMKRYNPESATMVIMDPQSGDILALANRPAYDLNQAGNIAPDLRRNRAVTDFFEPGSTFKPFVASAALEEGVVKLTDKFYCEQGAFKVARHILHDAHSYGTLSVKEIISKSSNIGMAKVGLRLGAQRLYNYVRRFGFGDATGIELPGEVGGWVHPVPRWSKLTPYMMSMGQELTVTAMQMTRAYCILANGGKVIKPRIVSKIEDAEGRVIYEAKNSVHDQILSEQTVKNITDAMEEVVSTEGTGLNAKVEGYAVAGKTGTAQKINPGGGYSHSKFVSSFIGFLPADRPEAVISVIVNEPKFFHYGGTVAAPSFKQIARSLMRYMEVPPENMYAMKGEKEE